MGTKQEARNWEAELVSLSSISVRDRDDEGARREIQSKLTEDSDMIVPFFLLHRGTEEH